MEFGSGPGISQGLFNVARGMPDKGSIVIGRSEPRTDLQGLVEIGQGLFKVALFAPGHAPVVIGQG